VLKAALGRGLKTKLNREDGKIAKRVFCWFVLILKEGPKSEQAKPNGQLTIQASVWAVGQSYILLSREKNDIPKKTVKSKT